MKNQLVRAFRGLKAGRSALTGSHVSSYRAVPTGGPAGHSALAAGGRSVLEYPALPTGGPAGHSTLAAGGRPASLSSLAVQANTFGPPNTPSTYLRGYSTARGIPSLLKGAEDQERIASGVLDLVGWTPMVELSKMAGGCGSRIVAKLEYYQPLCSIKDRAALRMIEEAEEKGLIKPGVSTLVEITSGNTGIGLAYVAAAKGYDFIAIMQAGYSMEKQTLLLYLGAKVVLSDPARGYRGMVRKLVELRKSVPNLHYMDQFANPANPDAHVKWTGPEIWQDTAGQVDILVAASGTGGTVSGVGRYLKSQNPAVQVICVEPAESRVLSGYNPQPHRIQGVGPEMIPKNLDRSVVDEIVQVTSDEAIAHARRLATEEGLLVGISSGANMAACLKVAAREDCKGKMFVTVLPSAGERYVSSELFEKARKESQALTF